MVKCRHEMVVFTTTQKERERTTNHSSMYIYCIESVNFETLSKCPIGLENKSLCKLFIDDIDGY